MAVSSEYLMNDVVGELLNADAVIGEKNVQEWAQHTSLWHPGVNGEYRRCGRAHPYCLQSVCEEVVGEVDQMGGDVEVV